MSAVTRHLRRAFLPGGVFIAGLVAHYLWSVFFHEQGPVQGQWAMVPAKTSGIQSYIESQGYWLGYSYAFPLAFAASALRRYRELRCCAARTLAIGGLALSGILAAGGCFLLGCCGSPMLVVCTTLFGAEFLPFTKPFVAVLTTASIGGTWWWMNRNQNMPAGQVAIAGSIVCQNGRD